MLTWECLVDTVRDDLPFILSVSTGCAISASCLEKRKHFYLRVALTILLTFCWMYGTRPYVGLNIEKSDNQRKSVRKVLNSISCIICR